MAIYAYTFASLPVLVHTHLNVPVSCFSVYKSSDRRLDGCGTPVVQFRHQKLYKNLKSVFVEVVYLSMGYQGQFLGVQNPSEILKTLQNPAKNNPIAKTEKFAECRTPSTQDIRKKAVEF